MRQGPRKWIHIPEPCHEDWTHMVTLGDGRRQCERCCHPVRDFTALSDAEVRSVLAIEGTRCGRFSRQQLERLNRPAHPPVPERRPLSLAALSLTSLLFASGAAGVASAEDAPVPTEQSEPAATPEHGAQAGLPHPAPVAWIKGQVYDARQRWPLRGVRVAVRGTRRHTVTDAEGRFELGLGARAGSQESVILDANLDGFTAMGFELSRQGWDRLVIHLWPAEESWKRKVLVALSSLPSPLDPWALLESGPGEVTMGRVDIGGDQSGEQSLYISPGQADDDAVWGQLGEIVVLEAEEP